MLSWESDYKTARILTRSQERLIAGLGIENIFVIETNDSILIADAKQSQDVKHGVSLLKEKNMIEGIQHKSF